MSKKLQPSQKFPTVFKWILCSLDLHPLDKTLRFLQAIAAEVAHPLCRPNELVAQLLQRKQNESICEFLVVTDLRFCIVSRQNRLAKELGK